MTGKPSIIFVDDEGHVLEALSRNLATEYFRWDLTFCDSPERALELFRSQPFNVVVVDMMMPGLNAGLFSSPHATL